MWVKCPACNKNCCNECDNGAYCISCGYYRSDDTVSYKKPIDSDYAISSIELCSFALAPREIKDYGFSRLPKRVMIAEALWAPALSNGIVFPIYIKEQLVCINVKLVGGRYKTYGNRKNNIYRFERFKNSKFIVLTEGPFDALSTPHGVASFGIGISDAQLKLLSNFKGNLLIAFDSDKMGSKFAFDLQKRLKEKGKQSCVLQLPKDKDPNDLGYSFMSGLIYERLGGTLCKIL